MEASVSVTFLPYLEISFLSMICLSQPQYEGFFLVLYLGYSLLAPWFFLKMKQGEMELGEQSSGRELEII